MDGGECAWKEWHPESGPEGKEKLLHLDSGFGANEENLYFINLIWENWKDLIFWR